jgi:hypothetical protein
MRYSVIPVVCISAAVLLSGAVAANAATASGSPATVRIGRFTEEFAGSVPSRAAQGRVIDGFRQAQILWDKSEEAWRLVSPVTQFVIGDALSHLDTAIKFDKQQGVVLAGTDEFFKTTVTRLRANSATVTTCDNGSKITGVIVLTGKVDTEFSTPSDQAYALEYWSMVQRAGHWAISSFSLIFLPDSRAKPCQP